MNKPMMVEVPIMVKSYEIDCVGIVSNIVYIKWFEDLRHYFLDRYYPYREMMENHVSPILIKTQAEYKASLTITDRPIARCWMEKLGKVKWEIHIEIELDGKLCCAGVQKGGFFDTKSNELTTTPKVLLDAYHAERKEHKQT